MRKSIIFLILTLFTIGFAFGQPGENSGILKFKIYNDGKIINLSDTNWKVNIYKNQKYSTTKAYKSDDYYAISDINVENFYVDILFKKDTMRIYTPLINFNIETTITFDSIPFRKGNYKIPKHIYELEDLIKKQTPQYNYIPKIKDNWDLFSTKKEVYKCYIEKLEDLDVISSSPYSFENGNTMNLRTSKSYYFKKNFIIENYDGYDENMKRVNKHSIYEIKNISDSTFWGSKIDKYEILSLYSKKNVLYALIKKNYTDLRNNINSGETYGIYKLYFINEGNLPEKLTKLLKNQQIEEDYRSAMKLQGYGGALREKIEVKYNKIEK